MLVTTHCSKLLAERISLIFEQSSLMIINGFWTYKCVLGGSCICRGRVAMAELSSSAPSRTPKTLPYHWLILEMLEAQRRFSSLITLQHYYVLVRSFDCIAWQVRSSSRTRPRHRCVGSLLIMHSRHTDPIGCDSHP